MTSPGSSDEASLGSKMTLAVPVAIPGAPALPCNTSPTSARPDLLAPLFGHSEIGGIPTFPSTM